MDEYRIYGAPLYWRETHKLPRFLIFDGRVVLPILLSILHMRLWTIILTVIVLIALFYFDRKGISADSIARFLRAKFVGSHRTARGVDAERSFVDYGFETPTQIRKIKEMNLIEAKRLKEQKLKNNKAHQAKKGKK